VLGFWLVSVLQNGSTSTAPTATDRTATGVADHRTVGRTDVGAAQAHVLSVDEYGGFVNAAIGITTRALDTAELCV
jgi:hypothetical protein